MLSSQDKGFKTLEKSLSLFQKRDHFAYGTAVTEIGAQFVESATKACRFNGSKAVLSE
jgi:hypothetical protein